MTRLALTLLIASFLIGPRHVLAAQAPGRPYQPVIAALVADRDPGLARTLLKRMIDSEPSNLLHHYNLACIDEGLELWDEAIQHYETSLKLGLPDWLAAEAKARKSYCEKAALDDKTPETKARRRLADGIARSRALLDRGLSAQALLEAALVSKEQPNAYEPYILAVAALTSEGRFKEANSALDKARERMPDTDKGLADLLLEQMKREYAARAAASAGSRSLIDGDFPGAVANYRAALKLMPNREDFALGYAIGLVMSKAYTEAEPFIEKLAQSHSAPIAKRAVEIAKTFQNCQILRIPSVRASVNAIMLVEEKKYAEAQNLIAKSLLKTPADPELHGAMGTCLFSAQDYEGAITAFSTQIRIDSRNVDAWLNLGAAELRAGKHKQAIETYFVAAIRNSTNAKCFDGLGTALFMAGRKSEAASAFDAASELDPTNTSYVAKAKQARGE